MLTHRDLEMLNRRTGLTKARWVMPIELWYYPYRDHVPLKARVFTDFLANIGRQQMNVPGLDAKAFAA